MSRFAAVHRFLSGVPEGSLESWIADEDPAENALADEVLRQIGEKKTLAYLLTTIEVEEKRRRRRGWRNALLVCGGAAIAQGFLDSTTGLGHHIPIVGFSGVGSILIIFGGLPSRLHQHCVERLAQIDDRHTFSSLVAALVAPYRLSGNIVMRRLTQMLPELEVEDFAALSKAQQTSLFGFINPSYVRNIDLSARLELARALLLAVTRLGEGDALPATKRLANAKSKSGEDDTLQRTAQNCLPLLEKARDEQKAKVMEERKVVMRR